MKPKTKKGLKIATTLFFYSMIMLILAFSVATLKMKYTNDIANVMGIGFLPIERESSSDQKDLLFVKMQTPQQNQALSLNKTVVYYEMQQRQFYKGQIEGTYQLEDEMYYVIQGRDQMVSSSEILAVEIGHVNGLGSIVSFLQSPKGFALAVLMPVVFLWIVESIFLVRFMLLHHKRKLERAFEKAAEEKAMEVESEFEVIRKQLLKEFNLDK
jgi:mannose-6-phosphate isomerase-like protein (cupin superfamily)